MVETDYINNMLTSLPPFVLNLLLEAVGAIRYNQALQAEEEPNSERYFDYKARVQMHVHRTDGIVAVAAYLAREAGWDVSTNTVFADAYQAYDNGWRKKVGV